MKRYSGRIASDMPLFAPPSEMALDVKPSWEYPPGFRQSVNQGIFDYVTAANEDPKLLPATVFVGDSFFDGIMGSGTAVYFVETHRIRWKRDLKVSEIVANLPDDTRWLVIQFIEVSQYAMGAFANQDDVAAAVGLLQSGHAAAAMRR
jgi:hypothetical protein